MFMKAVEEIRAAGATVLIEPEILPDSFADAAAHICTLPYIRVGTELFLASFGPAEYHSPAEYKEAVGDPLPSVIIGGNQTGMSGLPNIQQADLESDPDAEATLLGPRRKVQQMYDDELDGHHLDGFLYPAIQMPTPGKPCRRTATSAMARTLPPGGSTCLGFPRSAFPLVSTIRGCPLASRSARASGTMAI